MQGTKTQIQSLSKCRPAGSDPRVEPVGPEKNLAGQGDPTRDVTCISQVILSLAGRGGVISHGSGRAGSQDSCNLTGQVGSEV